MSVLDEIRPEWDALKEAVKEIVDENSRLRNENDKMERLVTLLRNDCDIDASWDGLRNFWTIGLTEDGCLMRDRACKAEAENAKLRLLVQDLHKAYIGALNECEGRDAGLIWEYSYDVDAALAKSHAKFESDRHRFDVAMSELGIEAGEC